MRLRPEELTVVIDTREQNPYDLAPMETVREGLATADYSVRGLEELVAVERKELSDLISCIGPGRERFKRELHRIRAYPARCVIVEASWADLAGGNYRGRLNPESAANSVISWIGFYQVPFMFCGDRRSAEKFTRRFLFHAARRCVERGDRFRAATGKGRSLKAIGQIS